VSLAGLRLGGLPDRRTDPCGVYSSRLQHHQRGDDRHYLASIALEAKDKILARNHAITRTTWRSSTIGSARSRLVSYIKPKAATVCLVKVDVELSSTEFCTALIEATGVMFTPGSAFDMEEVYPDRFANPLDVLQDGLARFRLPRRHRTRVNATVALLITARSGSI